jgi:N-acetylglucosaminyl-diphospho-decaprenol L-rhamnosyltransferase
VGVVLVTYQSADDLPTFLESLSAAVAPYPLEVAAVDNASSDDSVRIVREFGAQVVANTTNVGLSAAINQAAAMTSADWLLIANPDTRLTEGSIARLVETALNDERIGCVGPRIRSLDGAAYPTGRRFPSVGVGIAHAVLGTVWKNNPATRAYFGGSHGGDVDWVSGSCMLLRRSAFDDISGFDTGYFMYFEETDACLRLHRNGWRVVFDPEVEIYHREGGSTRFAPFRKVYNHHRSALRFYCRHHRRDLWLLLAPAVAAGLVARAVASLLRTAVGRARSR